MRNTYLYDGQTRNIFRVFIWKIPGQRQLRKVRKDLKGGGLRKRGKEETSDHWQSVLELSNLRGPTIRETNSVTNLTNAHTSTENKFPYS